MKIFNRIKNIWKKENGFTPLLSFGGFSFGKKLSLSEVSDLGFRGWQHIAISTIADAVSGLKYRLCDKKGEEIQSDVLHFITPEFLEYIAIFMKMTGTAYVRKIMSGNKILGLNFLLPQNIYPKIDKNGFLVGRKYFVNGKEVFFEKDEVIVFANANPHQSYPNITRGYSPIQAIATTIKGEEAIEQRNYSVLTGGDRPGTLLTTDREMTSEQVQMVMQKRNENHGGPKNAGKSGLLPFGIKPFNIVSSPKEMDFVNEKKRDMEKILAVYKVPKAIIGMGEGVNVGNVDAFNKIFAERTIKPLATKIARIITDSLFSGVGNFEFVNILPADEEEIRNHFYTGGITRNEYREAIGYSKVKGGDIFIDGDIASKEEKSADPMFFGRKSLKIDENDIKKVFLRNTKGTDDYMQKQREAKIKRMDTYEKNLSIQLKKIFARQEKDILKKFDEGKSKKSISDLKLAVKYYALYQLFLKKPLNDIVEKEGQVAMGSLSVDFSFDPNSEDIKKGIKEKIGLIAKNVDKVTDKKIKTAIKNGVEGGLLPSEIKTELKKVFKELSEKRAETIVRTESIRMGTYAQQKAREQSGVVTGKQWRTALDERTCPSCGEMHGKKIGLKEKFFEKGDKFGNLKLDYDDVIGSPLHPHCRCDLIPIEG